MKHLFGTIIVGLLVCAVTAGFVPAAGAADGYQYLAKWGSKGAGDGQFDGIGGIAIDNAGNVYVSDIGNKRIEKFSASGAYLAQWGTLGSTIDGVAVDGSGNVYAADYWNGRILKFSSGGTYLTEFSTATAGEIWSSEPHSVAVDSSGNMWVTDSNNQVVKKFDSSGAFLGFLGTAGSGDGQFKFPVGVAVDPSDNVCVVDCSNYTVQKFSAAGAYLGGRMTICPGDANLLRPVRVGVDSSGGIYVADYFAGTLIYDESVKKFGPDFTFLTKIGVYCGSTPLDGAFASVAGIAVAPSGNVYLADSSYNRVMVFSSAPTNQSTTTKLTAPATVKVGKTLKLSGTVSPAGAAGTVKITKSRKVGQKWKSMGSATAAVAGGSFKYSFKPKLKGYWRFVAKYSGGGGYLSSKSAKKTVRVK